MGAAMAMGGVVGPVHHSLIITLGLILGAPVSQRKKAPRHSKAFYEEQIRSYVHFRKKKHFSRFLFTRQFNFTVSQNIGSFNMN